jgi:tRNA G10  N-methylase Trm11
MTAVSHPARYSDAILETIASHLEPGWSVLDPLAGVGRVHELPGVKTWGIELEPEWANQHDRTVCYDARNARDLFTKPFDAIVTSPAYGNRMADNYAGDPKGSRRHTYRIALGRPLTAGSGAALQWGTDYRQLHTEIWAANVPLIRPGGLLILNCKNHIRNTKVQRVVEWHLEHLRDAHDLELVAIDPIPTAGIPDGSNSEARVSAEIVAALRKPEPSLFNQPHPI